MSSVPQAVKSIIIINVLAWIMTSLDKGGIIFSYCSLYPGSGNVLPVWYRPWTFVTYMFLHGGFAHLFFNMYALFLFGSVLERVWGTRKFLFYYFATGIGAGMIHIVVQMLTGDFAPTVGASGAIFGLLLGYAMLYPDTVMGLIFPPVRMKAKWFVLIYAAIELLLGVSGAQSGVAHFAHLGGLLVGLAIMLYWKRKGRLYSQFR
ncbi:MAG: rhomboid family intramembrane serine protease [Bacteroidales bacterium]|nr:rhomboid family intramembrane serine protease [Bacteroidales bacterium]